MNYNHYIWYGMFSVIYHFKVKAGKEEVFLQAWLELTKLIYEYEGSLGSRIHQSQKEGDFIAYAQWPSRNKWENAGANLPESAQLWRKQMKDSCDEIKTLFELDQKIDYLNEKPYHH